LPITLILGGARSGKSAFAQRRAETAEPGSGRLVMVVTAQAHDEEMAARIAHHRAGRDSRWTVVEAPLKLAGAIDDLDASDVAVIDCLTLWLSNLMGEDGEVAEGVETLATAMSRTPARLLVVSNEVGWGIVPDNALARRFRDDAGRLHQTLAEISDEVALVVAGLPLWLKAEVPR
jgi:adenosylcobinamide kinase/adenosylcobinamide-phosphate guanylyltransferase